VTLLALPSFAQDAEDDPEVKRLIEAQQKQIEAQQKQIESLQKALEEQGLLLQEFQALLQSLAAGTAGEEVMAAVEEPLAVLPEETPVPERPSLISQQDKHDQESPSGSNVTYFDSSAKGMIPGSETEVGVHGLIEFQMFHDTVGLNNNRFDTATIPVDGGPSQTKFNVNPTQLAVSTRTPVEKGRLNTWFSLDLNGQLDRPDPRLRVAFGEYVNDDLGYAVLVGQTYSTMLDMRAVPETLDFALPAGLWQLRQPLLRVSTAVGKSLTTEISVETPENVVYADADAEKRTNLPDLVVAGTWLTDSRYFKHFRLAGLARDLQAEIDGVTSSALGWAVAGSTKVGLGARDNLKVTVHYGEGYGTAVKGGPAEGVFNPETLELEPIGTFATYGGLQHFWSEQFRSNLGFGLIEVDNPDFVAADFLKSTTYFAANFIWSPFATTRFGFEYLWGEREDEDGESGTTSRFLLSSRFQF
jgi:hypothetical protein